MWQPSRHFVVVRRIKALMKIMQILKLDKSRTLSGVKGFMCRGKRCLAKEVCGVKFGGKGFLSTSCLASTSCRVFCMHSLTL